MDREGECWLTPQEAARLLEVSPPRIAQLADSGVLDARRGEMGRLISLESVRRLKATRRVERRLETQAKLKRQAAHISGARGGRIHAGVE